MVAKHMVSFKHAFDGLIYALKSQPNFSVHLTLSFAVVVLGFIYQIAGIEWIIIWLTITLGLVIELINTAIEAVVDLATDKWHHHAKIAKDVSAAAMLTFAFGSLVIAGFIFVPKL